MEVGGKSEQIEGVQTFYDLICKEQKGEPSIASQLEEFEH